MEKLIPFEKLGPTLKAWVLAHPIKTGWLFFERAESYGTFQMARQRDGIPAAAVVFERPETLTECKRTDAQSFWQKFCHENSPYLVQCAHGIGELTEAELKRAQDAHDGLVAAGDTCPECGKGEIEVITYPMICGAASRALKCPCCGTKWQLPALRL